MLKALFDFKGSPLKKVYKAIMLIAIIVAIVIVGAGCMEIVDVAHMKEVLGMAKNAKLISGDVMMYMLKKYVVWALAVLAVGVACFYTLRAKDRKAQGIV